MTKRAGTAGTAGEGAELGTVQDEETAVTQNPAGFVLQVRAC